MSRTLAVLQAYFNPRAPSGARRQAKIIEFFTSIRISIHALRAERDFVGTMQNGQARDFNPRAPSGARLAALFVFYRIGAISIHALRAERDNSPLRSLQKRS